MHWRKVSGSAVFVGGVVLGVLLAQLCEPLCTGVKGRFTLSREYEEAL